MNFSTSVLNHIIELRIRIIKSLIVFLFASAVCYASSNKILLYLSKAHNLHNLASLKIFELFFTQIKISLFLGFLMSFPYITYHIWSFISPALRKREKKLFIQMIIASSMLFFLGAAISYTMIVPLSYKFLLQPNHNLIQTITSVENYVNFLISTTASFGIGFQFPIVMIILVKISIITIETLKNSRKIVFLSILIIACIITPPDIISPIILTLILQCIYEVGLLIMLKKITIEK